MWGELRKWRSLMPKRRVRKWKNEIKFNCGNYKQITSNIPNNCYNCGMRNGYPSNLGGDESCENFIRRLK